MRRAATLYALGSTWAEIAAALGRKVEGCRSWPKRHAELWRRLVAKADDEAGADLLRRAHRAAGELLESDDGRDRSAAVRAVYLRDAQLRALRARHPVEPTEHPDDAEPVIIPEWCAGGERTEPEHAEK